MKWIIDLTKASTLEILERNRNDCLGIEKDFLVNCERKKLLIGIN